MRNSYVSMGTVLFDTFLGRIEWIEEVHRFRQAIRGFRVGARNDGKK